MALQIKTLFNDPSPNGFINIRYVQKMFSVAQEHTDLSEKEFDIFLHHLLFVAKKMVGTWTHLDRYCEIEDVLIEQETEKPPIQSLDIQHIVYSQDLLLEFDEFLVQLKSTLDYLAKLPGSIIGKDIWPFLQTFGDKGGRVIKAIQNNVPKEWKAQGDLLTNFVLIEHRPWLEMAIDARDKINHYLDGGIDQEIFLVAKITIEGEDKVVVPIWHDEMTIRNYMQHTWYNLMHLVEQFTMGFLAMRLKPGLGYVNIPKSVGSLESPIIVAPFNAVDAMMKFGQVIYKNRNHPGSTTE